MSSTELGRIELQAAIAVLSETETIHGDELRFARKAMGMRQPDLAALLDVATETVSFISSAFSVAKKLSTSALSKLLQLKRGCGEPRSERLDWRVVQGATRATAAELFGSYQARKGPLPRLHLLH
jgi:transcriptional regulator with XRE-family HTH domain